MADLNQGHMRTCFGLFLLVFLYISTGLAPEKTLTVNPDRSEVVFSLGDVLHQVHGTFLHGTPHDLALPTQIHMDGTTCTAKTHFMIPYVDVGAKGPWYVFAARQ